MTDIATVLTAIKAGKELLEQGQALYKSFQSQTDKNKEQSKELNEVGALKLRVAQLETFEKQQQALMIDLSTQLNNLQQAGAVMVQSMSRLRTIAYAALSVALLGLVLVVVGLMR